MPKVNIKPENKAENFDAIAPQKNPPVMIATTETKKSKTTSKVTWLLVIFGLASAGTAFWLFNQYQNLKTQMNGLSEHVETIPEANSMDVSLIDKINQHILLPHGEEPEITTIANAETLKQQESFFEYSQNGDALVKFKNLEIIYNPIADVIVNARSRGTVAGVETRAVQGAITIDIRNGSGVAGVAGKTAESFKGVKDFIVQNIGNAGLNNYAQTVVVNLSSKDLTGLEKQFNTKAVTEMPKGEKPSTADVVIILGKK
jgi:hypothetical protein